MQLAKYTLQFIQDALEYDGGSRYRGFLRELMPLADDAYSTKKDEFRTHLGASLIGRECPRELWYGFRWSTLKVVPARIVRLFNRGHLEEPRMVALLKTIGCEVWQFDETGKQFRISGHQGHFGGSLDAAIKGIPDLPTGIPALGEFKTHNDKSYQKLVKEGVLSAKWEHFVQQQIYMGKKGLTHSLYMATNKNDDDIHAEIIEFDPKVAKRYEDRAGTLISATSAPPKINNASLGWYKCKFCDHKDVCLTPALPHRTCRSCKHSTPIENGQWFCRGLSKTLSKEDQQAACEDYAFDREAYQK